MADLFDRSVLANLDLLRLAIARCEDITLLPPTVKLRPVQLLVGPGFPAVLIKDPATIAFMTAMRLEGVKQRFRTHELPGGQGQVLLLILSLGLACVEAPVARTRLQPVGMDARFAAPIDLTLQAVLGGLTRTLAHQHKPDLGPVQDGGKIPSIQQSQNRDFGQVSGA